MIMLLLAGAGWGDEPAGDAPSTAVNPATVEDVNELVGVVWQWVVTVTPVERFEASDPARYSVRFLTDGRMEAQFDCNRGGGSYEKSGNTLSFGPIMATRMACPQDTQDSLFMEQLDRISTYFISDGNLYLEMPYDSGTMHFRRSVSQ